jgi:hypothetical protein
MTPSSSSSSSSPPSFPSYYRGSSFKGLLILYRSKPFILYARRQAPEISDQLELFEDYDEYDGDEYDEADEDEIPDMNDIKFHTNAVENNE